tara:strand:+ start:408 stop:512 length:105 start_codon:yes stop_codon:yes gene_type:complete
MALVVSEAELGELPQSESAGTLVLPEGNARLIGK